MKIVCGVLLFLGLNLLPLKGKAATPPSGIYHMAPSHWYTGFKDTTLEIILHTENADLLDIHMQDYPGVEFLEKTNSANRHIAYLKLIIHSTAQPGQLQFSAKPASRRVRYVKAFKFSYNLLARVSQITALTPADVLYRINIDRFQNGNSKNDRVTLKNAYEFDRSNLNARHGGDIAGIIESLDYLKSVGTTAIWLNQIQENDAPAFSHLGRAVTDHYSIDPRYGNMAALEQLQNALTYKNIKLCMDLELNQVGWFHWMYLNFDTGWFNNPDSAVFPLPDPEYLNYPGLSITEKKWIASHWMDPSTPDLNQNNPHIAAYLKQLCMWWTEYAQVSTWIIPDPHLVEPGFIELFIQQVGAEFPGLKFKTNTRTNSFASQANYVPNKYAASKIKSSDGITDFILQSKLQKIAASDTCDRQQWNELFNLLDLNIVYQNPQENLIFLDDIASPRCISKCKANPKRWEMITALSFCLQGTPSILYGSEIRLTDSKNPTAALPDFPNCDQKNMLTCSNGYSEEAKDGLRFMKTCTEMRLKNPTLQYGSLKLYAPADGIFSLFRAYNEKKIMVIVNDNPMERILLNKRYQQEIAGFTRIKNLMTGEISILSDFQSIPSHSTLVYELLP